MTIRTRIAPSPTGIMHIGTARTALFCYLYARHHGGEFLLRIEDTDKNRSRDEHISPIVDGLAWLGMGVDGEIVYQSHNIDRHRAVAAQLVAEGKAYQCYCTPEELTQMRETALAEGRSPRYPEIWRDRDPSEAPAGVQPTIRIKAPRAEDGVETVTLHDDVQGDITVDSDQVDDFIIMRADGTPTYMLGVVVDDHDAGITHVIRGVEHTMNMFRQKVIYDAMGWEFPTHAHVPLLHGEDGKKLSKRHGAQSLFDLRDAGYLPEAVRNFLVRLGWSHGDDEIFSDAQAIKWFSDLSDINKSPAQVDYQKLKHINNHYMRQRAANAPMDLVRDAVAPRIEAATGWTLTEDDLGVLARAMPDVAERTDTLVDLATASQFYVAPLPLVIDPKAQKHLDKDHARTVLDAAITALPISDFARTQTPEDAHAFLAKLVEDLGMKFGQVGPVIRAAVCGTMQAPDLSHVLAAMGHDRVMARLSHC